MVDRVKYFMLGLLFLVVAGVIAYDRWNSPAAAPSREASEADDRVKAEVEGAQPPSIKPTPLTFPPKPDANGGKSEAERDAEKLRDRKSEPIKKKPDVKPVNKPPEKKKQPARIHVVKSGDSLERIALHYYNTRMGVDWIVKANGLKDRNRIFQNQKLIIPARKDAVSTKKTKTKTSPGKIPSRYVVKADENLYAIARRFYGTKGQGARIARIMELNQLWSADVKAGTILILPPK